MRIFASRIRLRNSLCKSGQETLNTEAEAFGAREYYVDTVTCFYGQFYWFCEPALTRDHNEKSRRIV